MAVFPVGGLVVAQKQYESFLTRVVDVASLRLIALPDSPFCKYFFCRFIRTNLARQCYRSAYLVYR